MNDRTANPRRRRKYARPRELLTAALSLFIEKGFDATRTEEIAERAGVSKGTLYLYFQSKEDLFTDLLEERFFCEFPFESGAGVEAKSGSDVLRDVVTAWRTALIQGPAGGVVKLVFTEVRHFPALADFWVQQVMTPTRAVVREAVRRGIAGAEFRAVDPDMVMNALVLPIIATCLHRHAIDPYLPCRFLSEAGEALGCSLDLVLQGLVAA
jgi:AcrR family transcriptional regulator